jgi:hypothetical protein
LPAIIWTSRAREIEEGHLGVAVTLLLHWRRAEIVAELNERGIGSSADSDLIRLLNEERKGYAYDGDEPEFRGDTVEHISARVEALVIAAEEAWSGA